MFRVQAVAPEIQVSLDSDGPKLHCMLRSRINSRDLWLEKGVLEGEICLIFFVPHQPSSYENQSDHYICQNQFSKDGQVVENISAVIDEERHSKLKRAISNAYAMTTIVEFEPFVDSTSKMFMEAMSSRFAQTGKVCPLDKYLQMYAFDIM